MAIPDKPRPLPDDREAVGQLLSRLMQYFRRDLLEVAAERGFGDVRPAHLAVFGNLRGGAGVRLTTLAARADLSLAATAELVDGLQKLGYLERVPDPSDGRARLIQPTADGRVALAAAGERVAEIEARWADMLQPGEFDHACRTLDQLLTRLDAMAEAVPPRT